MPAISNHEALTTGCCIAGGGPAGMMLGFLLARAGVEVVVLEKHPDFLRDFRGDTIHPSTLEVIRELGLLDEFLKLPHEKARRLSGVIGDELVQLADFTYLRTGCRFIAMMPQWDFLNFLAGHAERYPNFHLHMQAEVTDLIEEGGRIAGVRASTPAGLLTIRSTLVVGADGRHSMVRERAGLVVDDLGAPIDVLWMRLSRRPSDDAEPLGRIAAGKMMVMINRGDYWQCAFLIAKGGADEVRARGLESFRAAIVGLMPNLYDRVGEIGSWDDVKLLTVKVDRLRRWYRPGLLCIGDAAHAMSPVGGVGINLAIQDAVAAANILAEHLGKGTLSVDHLAKIQRRRSFPTRLTQRMQAIIQKQVLRGLDKPQPARPPWPLRLLERTTLPCRMRTRFISVGFRPEHVKTPDVY